jgi:hypothetical protein
MDERVKVARLINAWTPVAEREQASVQILFFACLMMIRTMGPAYCRIASSTLMKHADDGHA